MWLTKLKIAVVEKDADKLSKLLDDVPKLEEQEDIENAIYLLREASELMHTLKDDTASTMRQVEKNLSFLRSTQEDKKPTLDIRS